MNTRPLRRALHIGGGTLAGALACVAVGAGALDGAAGRAPTVTALLALSSVLVLVVSTVARRVRFVPPSARAQRVSFWLGAAGELADVEVALALVAGTHAVLAVTGGADSAAYPVLYAVIAFSVSFQARAGALAAFGAALALELVVLARGPADLEAASAAAFHIAFLAAAAAAHAVFLRGLISRQRAEHARRLDREVAAQRESAVSYRLISAALGAESRGAPSRAEEERLLASGGVATISDAVASTLALLKRAMAARSCALLWLDEGGESLLLKEVVSDSDDIVESPRVRAKGVVGAIVRDRAPLLVPRTKPGQLPYYDGDLSGAFAGTPVLEGPHLRGVLCADRDQHPFDDGDLELMSGAAEQIVRMIQSEQVFVAVERSKYEHERFYQASAMLCQALTLEQVMETAFDAACQIVDYDAAAITIFDATTKRHRVYAVREKAGAEGAFPMDELGGLEFKDNSSIAAMVVKNRHYLPAGGELRDITAPIYTRKVRFKQAESLLVLPLLSADEAVGTFMMVSRRQRRFGKDVREMLGIIANQVAVSLQNAMMYRKMETMATTDGLTGLTNHRAFQERTSDLLERANRHGHKAALLLCDIDHFKQVNDTYGHPLGDEALRRVARILQEAVRKIDITARYGGEEFVVVLEATDEANAVRMANRIRQDVAALVIESDKGPVTFTQSIGLAIFPDDARDKATLIERADHALYHAKDSGRDRVVTYQQFAAARKARKAG